MKSLLTAVLFSFLFVNAFTQNCTNWLQLNAQPAYVNIGDLDVPGDKITVEAQYNRTTPYSGGPLYAGDLVSKHTGPTDVNYLLRPNHAEITTSNGYFRTPDICESELNKTYHVAFTYDGATLKFYRDGFLMSQVAATGTLFQNNLQTRVGLYSANVLPTQFVGYINEVRIWNVVRSQAEIRSNMITSLPTPTTQPGLQAYYTFDNLINKQGNATWNATLTGSAALNATNSNCALTPDSCKQVVINFTTPDTVCVNTPVTINNTTAGASSYYWNFCVGDLNTPPAAVNMGNPNSLLSMPVFIDYAYSNGNYYGFTVNFNPASLIRLDFGNSLLNTPTAVNLGNYGGLLQNTGSEGIQVVQNEGKWYAIIVGGSAPAGTVPRIVKIDFGANINSPGVPTDWGNIGNLNQPIDLHVFKEGANWYGFTVNAEGNTITRFNFTNSFNNTPTGVNLGNIGGLQYPTGIHAINDNGFWRVFITNGGDNQRIGTLSSLTRLDFGASLLNTPTAVNLGNPGNVLKHPRDFTIMKFCGQVLGFAVNGNASTNDIVRLNFNNDLTTAPTLTSLGNLGNLNFPHSISKLFRVNDDVYAFITNVSNNTITRLRFQGCTNASVSSSTDQNPAPVTYNTPGTYNINLTVDDGLPTQTAYCRQVVVMPALTHTPTQTINICTGTSIKIGTGVKYAQYTWNTGATTDSIIVNTPGTYWVQMERFGCSNRDSMIVSYTAPVVNIGADTAVCAFSNFVLDAGNAGATFLWQNGSTGQTFTVNNFGKYYVQVTLANGCVGSDTINITPGFKIPADFYYKQDICNPLSVQFFGVGNNLLNPYWDFGDGNTTTGSFTPVHTYPGFATYTVKFGIESGVCKDTITKVISINVTTSNLILTPDTTICFNAIKQLRTQPALGFCWTPTMYLNNPAVQDPVTSTPGNITYYFMSEVAGKNIITNGDFTNGNTGFTSKYNFANPNLTEGQYFIGANPQAWNPSLGTCRDHTTGTGNMLMVNGSPIANEYVWSSTITVTPNTNYAFSAWLQNLNVNVMTSNPARLQFSINGIPIGNIFQSNITSCIWERFYETWNSGNNTTAIISVVNQNTLASGNDFALDDISFAPVFIQRDSVVISVDTPVVRTNMDTTICLGRPVQLHATGAATWSWTPATGLTNTSIPNPIATPTDSTVYIVTGTTLNGCTAKDTVAVNVFPIPTVISNHNVITCPGTPAQLAANNSMVSYAWTPVATLNNPAIANPMAMPAVNTRYTVQVTDANQCSYSDTVLVEIRRIPADFYYKQDICNPLSVQFFGVGTNLQNPYWDFGDGNTTTGSFTPVHPYPGFANYTVKFGIESGVCKDTITKVISINVTTSNLILTPDTTICFNAIKQLRTQPALGFCWTPTMYLNNPAVQDPVTSTPGNITYYFMSEVAGKNIITNGDFTNGNTGFTSKYNFANPNLTEGQYFIGANPQAWNPSLGTCHDHTTGTGNMLLVNGSPIANEYVWSSTITVTPNTNYAFSAWLQNLNVNVMTSNPARLQFSINGYPIGNIFQSNVSSCIWEQFYETWNSGNNTTAIISVVNQNTVASGNDFALDDISFAPVFIQRDSVIISVDTPVVRANIDTTICKGGQVQLQASGAVTWSWTPVAGLTNTAIANPIATPVNNTNYIVTGTTVNGCTAKDTVAVNVFPIPTVISNHDVIACPGTPVQLAANSSMASYTWTPAATLNNPAIANPMATPAADTRYTVQVTDANQCSYSDTVHVALRIHRFSALGLNPDICRGDSVTLKAAGGHTYLWSPAGSLDDATKASPVASPDTSTWYQVYMTESNCNRDTTIAVRVIVNPTPTVTAEKTNDIDCIIHSAQLNATGSAGNAYRWLPASGLDFTTMPNPVSTTDTTITYKVTGTNQYGCAAVDSVTVNVTAKGKVIFEVPNAFTPNGDSRNDCFGVKSWGGAVIEEFAIFNRWGERVFSTKNAMGCWDGRFKGQPGAAGGYVYVIKAKTFCGPIKRTGTLILVR